jgi:alpha-glucoside transport system substrate-binding protein
MYKRIWMIVTFLVIASLMVAACTQAEDAATPTPEVPVAPPADTPVPPADTPAPPPEETPVETPEETAAETPEETPVETPEETPAEPTTGEIDCMGAQSGDTVTMLYQWSGVEEENLNQILTPLLDECGISIQAESTRDQAILDTRVQAGNPPDIAFWNIVQVEQYQDSIVPVTDLGVNTANYPQFWQDLGTVGGEWRALPVKSDIKTIIWYSPINFDAFGYEVPETWEELEALADQMVVDGNVPWSMGFESGDATGWTGSDFIQDIMLVQQGPDYVHGIIDGSVPYNDDGVRQAWETYGQWAKDPQYTVGGAQGTLSTSFQDAIFLVFQDPPQAMMVKQSGFAGGLVEEQFPGLEYGTDFDFFQVPDAQGLQGGMDWMMAFNDTPAVQAIFSYLSSEMGGMQWAEVGFDLTPNLAGTGAYTNPLLEKSGRFLAEAEGFTPDIGDTIPGGFGSAEWTGIIEYVNDSQDLDAILDRLADVQAQAVAE